MAAANEKYVRYATLIPMRLQASYQVNSFLDLRFVVRYSLWIAQSINNTRRRLSMDMNLSEISSRGDDSLVVIHGFRVESYGTSVSSGFKRALRRLAEREFDDLCVPVPRVTHAVDSFAENNVGLQPIDSDLDAGNAVAAWWHASSELFANMFEDSMRGQKKVRWDECEPENLNRTAGCGHPSVVITLLPEVRVEDVRAETYALFTPGIRSTIDLPPIRPGLFGPNTDKLMGRLPMVVGMVRAERQ